MHEQVWHVVSLLASCSKPRFVPSGAGVPSTRCSQHTCPVLRAPGSPSCPPCTCNRQAGCKHCYDTPFASRPASRAKPKEGRYHNTLPEAPTFYPTAEEWQDPFAYLGKIAPEATKGGIALIKPPKGWEPPIQMLDQQTGQLRTDLLVRARSRGTQWGKQAVVKQAVVITCGCVKYLAACAVSSAVLLSRMPLDACLPVSVSVRLLLHGAGPSAHPPYPLLAQPTSLPPVCCCLFNHCCGLQVPVRIQPTHL
jgi:hypothetical protein